MPLIQSERLREDHFRESRSQGEDLECLMMFLIFTDNFCYINRSSYHLSNPTKRVKGKLFLVEM
jgi:hypothetical protein